MQIDPWGSTQVQDYARLRDEFGIEAFGNEDWQAFESPHDLFRRGVVFGHRDFGRIRAAVRGKDPWGVMTGLMPSGDMHLGHKMVIEQVIAHQREGADVHIAVADFEAVAARGFTVEKAREIALDQYVHNYLALGLSTDRGEVYFQTRRSRVKDLAHQFALRVNWSQMQALYGFGGDTTIAHVMAPLVQAADILHVQQEEFGGPRPILVPVGVDQDPHIRLTRDIAQSWRVFSVRKTDEGLGVFLKIDSDVAKWLDVAERAVRDMGYGELRRKDNYKALYIRGAGPSDIRAIDLGLARAEAERGETAFLRPAATFHRFMTGLTGGKMSSSKPESGIFLRDEPKAAGKKVMRSVTGGRATAEEQKRLGADPYVCPVYELFLYHLAKDDGHLEQVHDECKGGERLCGGCKKEAAGLLVEFLTEHGERRDEVAHQVDEIISDC